MIEVRVDDIELMELLSPSLDEMYVISKLKDAGIPIKGTFLFKGLKNGRLTVMNDLINHGTIYKWSDENEN